MIKTIFKWTETKDQKAMNGEDPHWFATALMSGAVEGAIEALVVKGAVDTIKEVGSAIFSRLTKKSKG